MVKKFATKLKNRNHPRDALLVSLCNLILFISIPAPAQIRFIETGATKTEWVSLQAPAAISSNFTWTLPAADGSANQCLATNGSGTLGWRSTSSGFSLDASDGSPVNALYVDAAGKVGIGTTAPASQLDVVGEIKLGNTSSTCNGTNEGQQRYNSGTKDMEFCNGTAWTSMTAPSYSMISTAYVYSTTADTWNYSSYVACPAGYTLRFYGLKSHYAGIVGANYHYCDCSSSGNSIRAGALGQVNVNYSCSCGGLCTK